VIITNNYNPKGVVLKEKQTTRIWGVVVVHDIGSPSVLVL
jgi:hypothetical protein